MVDVGLGEHGVVLELRLAERRSVAGNDDELGLASAEGLEGGLVAKGDCTAKRWLVDDAFGKDADFEKRRTLARLHHKREARVDGVGGLALLGGHRYAVEVN